MRFPTMTAAVLCTAALTIVSGCGRGGDYTEYSDAPASKSTDAHAHDHDHEHAHGPHDGHLIELGEEQYHAELVFDAESRITAVYVLGADAKTAAPIEAEQIELHLELAGEEVELALVASPQDDDPEGQASRFELAAEALPEAIHDVEEFIGHVVLTIDGEEFEGEISHEHEAHADHEKSDAQADEAAETNADSEPE